MHIYVEFKCPNCNVEQEKIDRIKEFVSEIFDEDKVPTRMEDMLREILDTDDIENVELTISYDDLMDNYKLGGKGEFIEGKNLIKCDNCGIHIPSDMSEEGGYWEHSNDYYSPDEFIENGYVYCTESCEQEHREMLENSCND